ncbi:MAG: histidinol dehydrogenase, partial [Candidatus Bathyarchaeia archaeon]
MPIKIARLRDAYNTVLEDRWPRKRVLDQSLVSYVEGIIEDVKRRGDSALIDLTAKFDGVKLTPESIGVSREEINEAYSRVSEEQISAIKTAKDLVERFERKVLSGIRFEYKD